MESNQTIPITKDYKVLVSCITYNHSKYIVDALNGFAMQKTNFPFACIVMDDASTDGELEVIKDWLQNECDMERADVYDLELANVFIVPHQTNANCTMAVYFLKRNLYNEGNLKFDLVKDWGSHCEYLALCEGDDYWTDPEKLQMQSDCLDAHPEVDMCAHSYVEKHAITGKVIRERHSVTEEGIIPVEDVIIKGGEFFATASICYRISLENEELTFKQYLPYDYSQYIHGALRGGIYYFNRIMSVYRRNVPNSWTTQWKKDKNMHMGFYSSMQTMLETLDNETKYQYHQIILRRIFLSSVVYGNTPIQNLRIVLKNRTVFKELSLKQKVPIIFKCICPKLGHIIRLSFS